MGISIVDAVIFDFKRAFVDAEEIRKLVKELGSPPQLLRSRNIDEPEAFWQFTFERWLESDFETNLDAVYKAHEKLRPRESRPGLP